MYKNTCVLIFVAKLLLLLFLIFNSFVHKAIRSISSGSVKVAAFPFPEFGFYCNQFSAPSSSSSSNQDEFHEDIVDCNQQITPDTFRLLMLHLKQEQQSKHSFFSSASSLSATTLSPPPSSSLSSSFQKSKIMALLTYVNKMYSPKTLTPNSNLYPVVVQLVKNLNGLISQLEGSYVNSLDYAQQSVPSQTTTSQEGGQGDSPHSSSSNSNDVRHHIEEELLSQCLPYSAFPPFAYVL
jgi:hypothetical protein